MRNLKAVVGESPDQKTVTKQGQTRCRVKKLEQMSRKN